MVLDKLPPVRTRLGRIAYALSGDEILLAERVARKMEEVPRTQEHHRSVKGRGFDAHVEGAMAEIACCGYYGAEFVPVYGRRDSGTDFLLKTDTRSSKRTWSVQVKATPYFFSGIKLFMLPHDMHNADIAMLCAVDKERGYVEIVGYTTTKSLMSRPLKPYTTRKGEEIMCRWLTEGELERPKLIERNNA